MSSDRIYCALLCLYPSRFQARFGHEMLQIFRDCCREEPNLLIFWLRTLKDLVVSLIHEWRQEMILPDSEIDYPGLADSFMISVVVGTLLLGWGWTGATVALDLRPPYNFLLAAIVTLAMAVGIGILCARVVRRHGRRERPRILPS